MVPMAKARSKKPRSVKTKNKNKLRRQNEKMLAETGMSMGEKSGVSKRAAAAVRGDVASLGLSLTKAKRVADVARESKNKAMAAKRSAEKAAREAKKDAEEKQRLIDLAKDAADGEGGGGQPCGEEAAGAEAAAG
ncbi:unnamed protein product [Ectocarpus sp. 12 AP-2014]